jgi:predicted acetyltransferase
MEVRGAKHLREVDEAYELAARIFGANYFEAKATFARQRTLEPLNSLEDAVLVVSGEKVVGFVRILNRQFYSPAGIVKAGGITTVCTHPELRGQGWGLRVMEKALQRSRERGDAFSILFARRVLDGWYPRIGYVGIGCHLEMQVDKPIVAGTIVSFTGSIQLGLVKSYVNTYAEAYTDSYQDLFLSFRRTEDWWQTVEQRLAHRVGTKDFINVTIGDDPIGYFILRGGKVIEAASLRQYRRDFLAGLFEFCMATQKENLVLALPSGHWCVELLKRMNHTLSIRYSWEGGHMVRILEKDVFKKMIKHVATPESFESIEGLFDKYDVSDHKCAQELALKVCGALPGNIGDQYARGAAIFSRNLLPMLPTWSIVDEL